MKARLLRPYAGNYAGQIMSNVHEGDFPADVAEYFEDDDPAINDVREPGRLHADVHKVANDGTVKPIKGSDFEKSQQAKVAQVQKEHEDQQQAHLDDLAETEKKAQEGSKVVPQKNPQPARAANVNAPTKQP